ncbi:MAG: hypothetical protein WDZ70_00180 [Candidatus Paceibacterota bacterium]
MEPTKTNQKKAVTLWKRLIEKYPSRDQWPPGITETFSDLGYDITDDNVRFELHDAAFGAEITQKVLDAMRDLGPIHELPPPDDIR